MEKLWLRFMAPWWKFNHHGTKRSILLGCHPQVTAMELYPAKQKYSRWWRRQGGWKERESERIRSRTRVNGRAFTRGKGLRCGSENPFRCRHVFPLTGGSKLTFFLQDQSVTRPVCLLQLQFLILIVNAARYLLRLDHSTDTRVSGSSWNYWGIAFASDDTHHVANAVFAPWCYQQLLETLGKAKLSVFKATTIEQWSPAPSTGPNSTFEA